MKCFALFLLIIHYVTNLTKNLKHKSLFTDPPINLISLHKLLIDSYLENSSISSLISCNLHCNLCKNNVCLKCRKGLFLYNSQCYHTCPRDTYADNYSSTCKQVNSSPFYLKAYSTSRCQNSCDKQFLDCSCKEECRFTGNCCSDFGFCELIKSQPRNKECSIDNCKICNGDTCLQCDDNHYFFNNKCYSTCLINQVTIEKNRICLNKCNVENCEKCENGVCLKCLNGYYLSENECLEECPFDTRADKINLKCQSKEVFSYYWIFPSLSSCKGKCGIDRSDCSYLIYKTRCNIECIRKGNCCDDFDMECPIEFQKEKCKLCSECYDGNCKKCKENSFSSNHINCDCKFGYVFNKVQNTCEKSPVKNENVNIKNQQIIEENHQKNIQLNNNSNKDFKYNKHDTQSKKNNIMNKNDLKNVNSEYNVKNITLSFGKSISHNKTNYSIKNSPNNDVKKFSSILSINNNQNLIIKNEKVSFGKIKSHNNTNNSAQDYPINDIKKSSSISSIKNESFGKLKSNNYTSNYLQNSSINNTKKSSSIPIIKNVSNFMIGNKNNDKENILSISTEKINSKDQLKILSNNGNNQTNSLPNNEKLEESTIFGKMNNLKNLDETYGKLPGNKQNIIRNLNKSFVNNETKNYNKSVKNNLKEKGKNTEKFDGENRTEILDEKVEKNNSSVVNSDIVIKNKILNNIGTNINKLITIKSNILNSKQDKNSPINTLSLNKIDPKKFDFAKELKKHYNDMLETTMLNHNQLQSGNSKGINGKVISENEILNGNFSLNYLNENKDTEIINHNEVIYNSNNKDITKQFSNNSFNIKSNLENYGNINFGINSGMIESNLYTFDTTSNIQQEMNPLYLKILGLNQNEEVSELGRENDRDELILKSNSAERNLVKIKRNYSLTLNFF